MSPEAGEVGEGASKAMSSKDQRLPVKKCPYCGGPVEHMQCKPSCHSVTHGKCICGNQARLVTLPDTLEGIEADINDKTSWAEIRGAFKFPDTVKLEARTIAAAYHYKRLAERLFNGCAACGRKSLVQRQADAIYAIAPELRREGEVAGKRQAFQQAAEGLEALHIDVGQTTAWNRIMQYAAELRKLAEDV